MLNGLTSLTGMAPDTNHHPALDPWSLQLFPVDLETEFWGTDGLWAKYIETADNWTFLCYPLLAIIYFQVNSLVSLDTSHAVPWVHGSLLAGALSQRLFLLNSPRRYWRWRSFITLCNLLARMAAISLLPVDGASIISRAADELGPQRSVPLIVSLLALAILMPPVLCRLMYPLTFRPTVLVSLLWQVAGAATVSEMLVVVRHPDMQPGLYAVCATVHNICGNLLLLPQFVIEALVARCTTYGLWAVVFFQLWGFWWPVWHAHATEFNLKATFLTERGVHIERLIWRERSAMVLGVPLLAYISTFFVVRGFSALQNWGNFYIA